MSTIDEAHRWDNILKVASYVAMVYVHHGAGGRLHLVIDDNNVGDDSLGFCIASILQDVAAGQTGNQLRVEVACAGALLQLSEEDREIAINMYHQDGVGIPMGRVVK